MAGTTSVSASRKAGESAYAWDRQDAFAEEAAVFRMCLQVAAQRLVLS